MAKAQQNNIPQSIIKGSGFVNADFSFLSKKGQPGISFLSTDFTMISLDSTPYLAYATAQLNYKNLALDIRKQTDKIRMLILQRSSSTDPDLRNGNAIIPNWVGEFKGLYYLRLDDMSLDGIDHLEKLPIRHLVLVKINLTDEDKLLNTLTKLKTLKCLAYDSSVPVKLIESIKLKNKKLVIVTESEYYEKKLDESF